MAGRRPIRRAIKQHYSYTTEEAALVLGVAKGSVRRWLKAGLPHLADQRPFLILGSDLRAFLDKRDKPKQRCGLHEFYCFRCREPKPAAGGLIDYTPRTALRAVPCLTESNGFANRSRSDSSYLPMEVGRYVESPFR
ncbi:helix-turn-helix domain-containing protein [Rhizobium sp. XQZ8]|uniref:helix-turn-helix domain-containing protein n=1 Tax=Rhizobium populisoli TaxID=2859785 RepID=UPI001C67DF57|nr:helix-turn-helix domain-containing protein [Rhizobium populisoli]MBW6422019.1 helix-turn-helix domain-containing protein [Rhizobium populisoli]